jgi:uncharacterized membrane protein
MAVQVVVRTCTARRYNHMNPMAAAGRADSGERSDALVSPATLRKNISDLRKDREAAERSRTLGERVADKVTAFAGSMNSVLFHLLLYGGWLLYNSGIFPVEPFDPYPFVMLAMTASVEAIFLTTFVLISQNRNALIEERREDLGLHVSLLTEHEITRLAQLMDLIANRIGLDDGEKPELGDIKQEVAPVAVLRTIDAEESKTGNDRGG